MSRAFLQGCLLVLQGSGWQAVSHLGAGGHLGARCLGMRIQLLLGDQEPFGRNPNGSLAMQR